jgi:hypothetical protein
LASDETAGIVEFKQRAHLSQVEIEEIAASYINGSPRAGGLIIVNYDITGLSPKIPAKCTFLEGLRPGNEIQINGFKENLHSILRTAGLIPGSENVVVLLDVSSSMGQAYEDRRVQDALRIMVGIPWIRIFRFSDGLLPGGDLDGSTLRNIQTSGGTELGQALEEIENLIGMPDRLLIVTDGEHDNPTQKLGRIPEVLESNPTDLIGNLDWLTSESREVKKAM